MVTVFGRQVGGGASEAHRPSVGGGTAAVAGEVAAVVVLVGLIGLAARSGTGALPLVVGVLVALGLVARHLVVVEQVRHHAERARAADRRCDDMLSHDPLTGLPNRTTAQGWIDERLAGGVATGVLVVDVDRLKLLAESYGHAAADTAVVVLAERTRRVVSEACPIANDCFTARGDGDQLLVVVPGGCGLDAVRAVGEEVVRAARAPITLLGHGQVAVTVSVGVALAGADDDAEALLAGADDDAEALLAGADLALNEAKQRGRARVEVLDEGLRARSALKVRREQDLRRAVTRHGEIEVWAQPVVELSSGIPVGAEALVRWRHPFSGVLLPEEFLTAAEDAGMMAEIGATVLDRACRALASGVVPWMTVNLSRRELYDPALSARVRDALARHEVEPARLCLEVHESALLDPPVLSTLKALEALGVGLAVDDFGVGASPLLQLQLLRRPLLKLDRSFVVQLDTSRADRAAAMIATFVHLAHQIDVHVVAEGVETETQAEQLRRLGVRYAQGFLFARPVAIEELRALEAVGRPELEAVADIATGGDTGRWVAWVGPPPWIPAEHPTDGAAVPA